jgi:hypothetical protein
MSLTPDKKRRLRYKYKKLYTTGKVREAKEFSQQSVDKYGYNLEMEYHLKQEQKEDPKDPFGIGRVRKLRYGKNKS